MLLKTLGFGIVGIEAHDAGLRPQPLDFRHNCLGAGCLIYNVGMATVWAAAGRRHVEAAAVAAQFVVVAVISQRYIAVRAGGLPAAILAHHHTSCAAPI